MNTIPSFPGRHAVDHADTAELTAEARALGFVIEGDPEMVEIFRTMKTFAPTPLIMSVLGETGSGKEPCARAIHRLGHAEGTPFVAMNCSEMNDGVLESELFGHMQGSFTGAVKNRVGKIVAAKGGTLLLDEIGDTTLGHQRRYLRTLEDWKVTPVGDNVAIEVNDVKIVTATNQDLEQLIAEKKFLQALYSRITACVIHLPPLHERRIEHRRALVTYLLEHIVKAPTPATLTADALENLAEHHYQNNVRELRQTVERAYWTALIENRAAPVIDRTIVENIAMESKRTPEPSAKKENTVRTLEEMTWASREEEAFDRALIETAILTKGNQSAMARILDITRGSLRNKILHYAKRHNVDFVDPSDIVDYVRKLAYKHQTDSTEAVQKGEPASKE